MKLLLAIASLGLLTSCAAAPKLNNHSTLQIPEAMQPWMEDRDVVLTGRYYGGFEQSEFRRCGGAPLEYTVSNARVLGEIARNNPSSVLSVRGRVTKPGHYGQFGAYKRLLFVETANVADDSSLQCPLQ